MILISDYLSYGIENAQTSRELARLTGLHWRRVTKLIEAERRNNGEPILANSTGEHRGYYLSEDPAEIEAFCGKLHHRAGEVYKTRRALIDTAKRLRE